MEEIQACPRCKYAAPYLYTDVILKKRPKERPTGLRKVWYCPICDYLFFENGSSAPKWMRRAMGLE